MRKIVLMLLILSMTGCTGLGFVGGGSEPYTQRGYVSLSIQGDKEGVDALFAGINEGTVVQKASADRSADFYATQQHKDTNLTVRHNGFFETWKKYQDEAKARATRRVAEQNRDYEVQGS